MANTWEVPIKCTFCALHFIVLTWNADWATNNAPTGCYCPECGRQGSKIIYQQREISDQIFRRVPGEQPLASMG